MRLITYQELIEKQETLALIGLGYVGLPIAVAFAKKMNVIGFDTNQHKIDLYNQGIDPTNEVGNQSIQQTTIQFTSNEQDIAKAKFIIVAVPTPICDDKTPNLEPLRSASSLVGRNLQPGSIIVFESTVYPGVTEEICLPILEKESGLICGIDFKIGYSPERINPGDHTHRLENIIKVVSGMDQDTTAVIKQVYETVVDAGVFCAANIKTAEAAKVIENCQRDINIAFMNELSIIFHKLGIETKDVLSAANTKWNFLNFSPGLVGGHCIGVDPYYLTYKAESLGYHSQIILSGRQINDDMGRYICEHIIKIALQANINLKTVRIGILGFTFKENCPDIRNTRVIDIIHELNEYGITPYIFDPVADPKEVQQFYDVTLSSMQDCHDMDILIFAVAHEEFLSLSLDDIQTKFRTTEHTREHTRPVLIDIKSIFNRKDAEKLDYYYWSL